MLTGILAPMHEEIELIIEAMQVESIYESGGRKYYKGVFQGKGCVVALSRIGKVASSVTAAVMIEKFKIDQLIVCGVAGAIAPHLKRGDIVVADECVQHDLDARPLFEQFEAPLLGTGFFACDPSLVEKAIQSSEAFLKEDSKAVILKEDYDAFAIQNAVVHKGQLCCGDQFIGSNEKLMTIRNSLPKTICVEMEGGAVGQICFEYKIPYVVIRTISDSANDEATIDFNKYIKNVAKYYTFGVVHKLVLAL